MFACFIISIHAPAWGATRLFSFLPFLRIISIHAPAWGATSQTSLLLFRSVISIHAPAWGATRSTASPTSSLPYFNPRARVGRDPGTREGSITLMVFQSTRPRGARRMCMTKWSSKYRFQSTRPRGARPLSAHSIRAGSRISIHAPAWGATPEISRKSAV